MHLLRRLRSSSLPLLTLVLLGLTIPLTLAAQQPIKDPQLHTASKTELGCIKVLLAQERAWNAGDIDTFAQGYKNSPDTLFLSRDISRGYAGMLQNYHHEYPTRAAMGTLSFTDLEVHPLDEHFAVVLGKYRLERGKKDGGPAEGLFSLVFEKTEAGWKIVVDHTT